MRPVRSAVCALLFTLALSACVPTLPRCEPGVQDKTSCPMPGWLDRAFDLRLPPDWDGSSALPIIYVFHGGAGDRQAAERVSCPEGDLESPRCLGERAIASGYAVVYPDGTGSRPLRGLRTWNAGGGTGDWRCVSGGGCRSGVDDLRYFDELHTEVGRLVNVDRQRVYATGLSNGAAFPHRLACQRADVLAAIAPVGGANQHAAAGGECSAGVAVLHIHGTADPCWTYQESADACLRTDGKRKVGVTQSLDGWVRRNGCDPIAVERTLADNSADGTTTTEQRWSGCSGDVEHLRINQGGHTWPGGYSHFDTTGLISRDFDANDRILEFFDSHRRSP